VDIKQFAGIVERLEAVSTTFRYADHLPVFPRKDCSEPLKKSLRPGSEIYGNIKHGTSKTANKFSFSLRRMLKMQPPHSAFFRRNRVVDLLNLPVANYVLQLIPTEKAHEHTPIVPVSPGSDNLDITQVYR
jgi:hypothetical protein